MISAVKNMLSSNADGQGNGTGNVKRKSGDKSKDGGKGDSKQKGYASKKNKDDETTDSSSTSSTNSEDPSKKKTQLEVAAHINAKKAAKGEPLPGLKGAKVTMPAKESESGSSSTSSTDSERPGKKKTKLQIAEHINAKKAAKGEPIPGLKQQPGAAASKGKENEKHTEKAKGKGGEKEGEKAKARGKGGDDSTGSSSTSSTDSENPAQKKSQLKIAEKINEKKARKGEPLPGVSANGGTDKRRDRSGKAFKGDDSTGSSSTSSTDSENPAQKKTKLKIAEKINEKKEKKGEVLPGVDGKQNAKPSGGPVRASSKGNRS